MEGPRGDRRGLSGLGVLAWIGIVLGLAGLVVFVDLAHERYRAHEIKAAMLPLRPARAAATMLVDRMVVSGPPGPASVTTVAGTLRLPAASPDGARDWEVANWYEGSETPLDSGTRWEFRGDGLVFGVLCLTEVIDGARPGWSGDLGQGPALDVIELLLRHPPEALEDATDRAGVVAASQRDGLRQLLLHATRVMSTTARPFSSDHLEGWVVESVPGSGEAPLGLIAADPDGEHVLVIDVPAQEGLDAEGVARLLASLDLQPGP